MKTISYEEAMELIDEFSDKYEFVEEIEGESGRWDQYIQIIFKSGNKYYAFDYSRGLTEMQENTIDTVEHYEVSLYSESYSDDRVEVYPVEKVVTTSYEYVPIKED
ncbi:hypothetical protein HWC08_gp018 [Lactobacillus phage 521B]|uniref:Uncharacterized protein n=1 Tax=Lactobacillus phage 521B TaxID=2510942 RepID=A0A4Y5FG14_9CAUD|nr:hypothetical protein HWC08_gp018 [Lactobacillus phage 521B]QBJ03368.1 hypothetical protein B521_0018 [Lactobacillus phage 521B]